MKKDHSRQRAHPENAPQCHICGRICSTTWNLKQHIEKHYDIHPQKGVLKKKFEETSRNQAQNLTNQQTGFHGFGNTQESIQIENQIQELLKSFQFRWLEIKGIDDVFLISMAFFLII